MSGKTVQFKWRAFKTWLG